MITSHVDPSAANTAEHAVVPTPPQTDVRHPAPEMEYALQHEEASVSCLLWTDTDGVHVRPLVHNGVIGRSHNATINLEAADVSRHHARVLLAEDLVYVVDEDSLNGTHVNGTRINSATALRHGDRVRVGSFELLYIER